MLSNRANSAGIKIIPTNVAAIIPKNTDVPILLIHGEDDHFVPLKMAFENRDACTAPCKLLVVPGADHAMSYYMGRGAYEAAMRAFWEHFDK